MKTVSILCASRNSVYHQLQGVIVFDERKDARTFTGDTPIVAHPPCRAWSAFCRHQAKPKDGEAELGIWCANMLRITGGVLEHPAHSRLFDAAALPKPGEKCGNLWTMEVWQAWWGYSMKKATWLCFSKIDKHVVDVPYRMLAPGQCRRRQQVMSKNQRAATCEHFARWLVGIARTVEI
jgi:hypothetical protein